MARAFTAEYAENAEKTNGQNLGDLGVLGGERVLARADDQQRLLRY